MIAKGTTHNNGTRLAAYMTTGKDGERAELWQLRGFEATNIKDAFRDVQIMAGATKCEQPFFHVQVRNREGETLTRQQWEHTADRIERMLGLSGQPRAITFHTYEHNNDEHMHVAWSRIDENTLTAIPLPFFKERLKKISRELEAHFALEPVTNQRESTIKFAPTRAEHEQARRLGLDVHELRDTIRACWDRSDCGQSFQAALEHEGMTLAQGERRDFVVIDQAGGLHALGKRIVGVTAAKIRDRLSDISRDDLPTVEMDRAFVQELGRETPEPSWDRDRDDRAWQDAVIDAAIEKEKEHEKRVRGQQEEEHRARTEDLLENLKGPSAEIYAAFKGSDNARAFVAALEEQGFAIAGVTRDDVANSNIERFYATDLTPVVPPKLREGDYVAIAENGKIYNLNWRTTGESAEQVQKFMAPLDRKVFGSVETVLASVHERAASREIERQVFRDVSAGELRREKDHRPAGRARGDGHAAEPGEEIRPITGVIGKVAVKTIEKAFEVAAGAFESLIAPAQTPAQKHEARLAEHKSRIDNEDKIDFARFTNELARQQENQTEAIRQRERGGRER